MTSESVFDRAYDSVRRHILANVLQPGDWLPPAAEMAAMFDVSIASLREALRALEAAGIVSIRHGVGTVVAARPLGPLLEHLAWSLALTDNAGPMLLELRQAVEMGALYRLVERITPDQIDALDTLVEGMSDPETRLASEVQFHLSLIRVLDNSLMDELIRFLWLGLRRQDVPSLGSDQSLRLTYALHVELVEGLRLRDLAMAQGALGRYYALLRQALARGVDGRDIER